MIKRLFPVLLVLLLILGLAGCTSTPNTPQESESVIPSQPEKTTVRLMGLSGPTTMGMAKLLAENDKFNTQNNYDFELVAEPAAVTAALAKGEVDIAAVPANLASVVYNNTNGGIRVIAVNTLGVLYIVETGETINSLADLKGKTIYATGKGSVPELTLNYLLKSNGIDPVNDLTIEYKTDPAEVAAIMAQGDAIAMLQQPFLTAASAKNENIRIAVDITEEWNNTVKDSTLVTGVAVVRTEFLDENPQAVADFLTEYQASINYVNENIEDSAQLIGTLGIVPAEIAVKAIPYCNLSFIEGDDMKNAVSGFLNSLYSQDPSSVGGKLPDDNFYYKR